MSGWTDERIERAKKLNADGRSASQIARDHGGVSRHVVVGKLNRLGLSMMSSRSKVAVANPAQAARERAPAAHVAPAPPERAPALPVAPAPKPAAIIERSGPRLLELGRCHCRFPIGDVPPGCGDEQRFCGAGFRDDDRKRPYCDTHMRESAAVSRPRPVKVYEPSVVRRRTRPQASPAMTGWAT